MPAGVLRTVRSTTLAKIRCKVSVSLTWLAFLEPYKWSFPVGYAIAFHPKTSQLRLAADWR